MANEEEQKNHLFGIKDLGHKTLLQSDALYQYILETSVYPREHECLKEIRKMTAKHPLNIMATPADEGQLLSMLVKLTNSKNALEIGVFTGYSLLSTALALPPDGKENKKGSLDFVFVDADKDNYLNYHKRVLELVKIGGLIGYDNTLWAGSVAAPPDAPLMDYIKPLRGHVMELNKYLAQDSRIEICQLPVGDGITLCRRII
ncbi:caffeoyl-CoA O-methyltransferase-like isoform X2 [Glycine soja]|uniref:O-methyltransferase SOMT-9 n=3 Tax=Glycine subgen. Soja TaxID=1462606 RepID=C6T2I6_SOYBN|nr:O-methyltransferase SOMT-9 isoform 2 [Glycine max]XP_028210180.1 caffeoyl-CoA O-methyltransferase-like isoform X2 [Glycine soja]ACU15852.1 unknown [Glycine max]RZB57280.1 Caffeoyl-CoA O-methyltransferase isoform D [Glycine soja]|eukprot:NP_001340280.1 O-methyltransferase SOMT-9 isoform 2 [Glycine max]